MAKSDKRYLTLRCGNTGPRGSIKDEACHACARPCCYSYENTFPVWVAIYGTWSDRLSQDATFSAPLQLTGKTVTLHRSKSPELDRRGRSTSRGRSPTPKRILISVATPDRYTSALPGKDAAGGLRSRLGKAGSAPAAAAAGKCGSGGGWKQLVRCLFDPSAARDLPPDSVALRMLEAGENARSPSRWVYVMWWVFLQRSSNV